MVLLLFGMTLCFPQTLHFWRNFWEYALPSCPHVGGAHQSSVTAKKNEDDWCCYWSVTPAL